MLPKNTTPDSTTTAVVAPRISNRMSGVHATASLTAVPLTSNAWSQPAAPPPKEVESAIIAQFDATVVVAIHDAYTYGGGDGMQRNQ